MQTHPSDGLWKHLLQAQSMHRLQCHIGIWLTVSGESAFSPLAALAASIAVTVPARHVNCTPHTNISSTLTVVICTVISYSVVVY